jgi:hypothetical protein
MKDEFRENDTGMFLQYLQNITLCDYVVIYVSVLFKRSVFSRNQNVPGVSYSLISLSTGIEDWFTASKDLFPFVPNDWSILFPKDYVEETLDSGQCPT